MENIWNKIIDCIILGWWALLRRKPKGKNQSEQKLLNKHLNIYLFNNKFTEHLFSFIEEF